MYFNNLNYGKEKQRIWIDIRLHICRGSQIVEFFASNPQSFKQPFVFCQIRHVRLKQICLISPHRLIILENLIVTAIFSHNFFLFFRKKHLKKMFFFFFNSSNIVSCIVKKTNHDDTRIIS